MANHMRNLERETHWRGILARFSRSGMSVREFCRRETLSEPSFYAWRRTLQHRDAEPASRSESVSRSPVPAFLPVDVRREIHVPAPEIVVELGRDLAIRVGEGIPIERIAALVRELQPGGPEE